MYVCVVGRGFEGGVCVCVRVCVVGRGFGVCVCGCGCGCGCVCVLGAMRGGFMIANLILTFHNLK